MVEFKTLKQGDTFEYAGTRFMKVEPTDSGTVNAVSIPGGGMYAFDPSMAVRDGAPAYSQERTSGRTPVQLTKTVVDCPSCKEITTGQRVERVCWAVAACCAMFLFYLIGVDVQEIRVLLETRP